MSPTRRGTKRAKQRAQLLEMKDSAERKLEPRVLPLNERPPRPESSWVLYCAQASRRTESHHGLAFAARLANRFRLPLLYLEELRCEQCANDRMHTFALEGVPEKARRLAELDIGYAFRLHTDPAEGDKWLLEATSQAAAIVLDDYPVPPHRESNEKLAARIDVAAYAVESSCVVPMSLFTKREYAAYTIRPKITRLLAEHMQPAPGIEVERPFREKPPAWHTEVAEAGIKRLVARCPIDHGIPPSTCFRGGRRNAERRLEIFLEQNLHRYGGERNDPTAHATSNLSPYLHFGQISSLETALAAQSYAEAHSLAAEAFLEELIVRRELAFNFALHEPKRLRTLDSLPDWVRKTLKKHARDKREYVYTHEQFASAETHDELWNAAQKELLLRGKIHGYYRMYWGKKIIEWSADHEAALETMLRLHDVYALDGRDPNTYTNILWCFGLHDRPWKGRPIFGTVRWMSLEGMRRKTSVDAYLAEMDELERTGQDPLRVE